MLAKLFRSAAVAAIVLAAALSSSSTALAVPAEPATAQELRLKWQKTLKECQVSKNEYARYYTILTDCFYGYQEGSGYGYMFFYEA